ncbi:MAG: META domain-containing protein [Scytonematopsis contorta HA4267-MV1]|jgi:heat shock protein HslJ|nr:META domain-containing protein [Scytonematopsis contorta HA4267-MV1]
MQTKMLSLKFFLNPVVYFLSIIGFLLTFGSALLACTESSSTQLPPISSENSPQSRIDLKNSSWQLERWERKGSAVPLLAQTKLSLNFEENQVNGFSGCNRFSGSFNLVNDKLSFGILNATQKGCDAVVMNQESQFLSALQSVRHFSLDASGNLELFYTINADEGVLYFLPMK